MQANAFIQTSLFRTFTFNSSGPVVFQISLTTLIVSVKKNRLPWMVIYFCVQECLNIFGGGSSGSSLDCSHTSLKICYAGLGHPLSLV